MALIKKVPYRLPFSPLYTVYKYSQAGGSFNKKGTAPAALFPALYTNPGYGRPGGSFNKKGAVPAALFPGFYTVFGNGYTGPGDCRNKKSTVLIAFFLYYL